MNSKDAGLYIVATPIGNLKDISQRAIEVINEADFIVCENPKHSLKLLNNLGIKKKLISLHDYNEDLVIKRINKYIDNKKIILISDAGSPLISDPGYKLVNHYLKNNIYVTSIPGPASLILALQLSGIPVNEFYFAGFFPKLQKQVFSFIRNIKEIDKTTVFFVSSHKIEFCLNILEKEIKDRSISISKELTKMNEKVFYGFSNNIGKKILDNKSNFKGEFVVVLEGKSKKETDFNKLEDFNKEIDKMLSKFSLTDVVEIVHKLTSISKNKVYKWVLSLKKS